MLQFLYRIKPTRPNMLSEGLTPLEAQVVGDHFAYLQRLSSQGSVLMAGRTRTSGEDTFGIVIIRAETLDGALAIMRADPAVSQHVMHAELFPYQIAIWTHLDPLAD
jgi:uncharacterized protein YciI